MVAILQRIHIMSLIHVELQSVRLKWMAAFNKLSLPDPIMSYAYVTGLFCFSVYLIPLLSQK